MELITFGAGFYSMYSGAEIYSKYRDLMNLSKHKNIKLETIDLPVDGIKLYNVKQNITMPFYVNTGTNIGVSVPIGGGESRDDFEYLYSRFGIKGERDGYEHYVCTDAPKNKFFINTNEQLVNTLNQYKIDQSQLLLRLPLMVKSYNMNNPVYRVCDRGHGFIGTNKDKVVQEFAFKTRRPLTIFCSLVALGGMAYLIDNRKKWNCY